jgi:membrane protein
MDTSLPIPDIPSVRRLSAAFRRTVSSFRRHHATRSAAAIAYYTIFSIVPMSLIIIAAAGLVMGAGAARSEILGQLAGVVGSATADAIQQMLQRAATPAAGILATVVGSITFLLGLAGVLTELHAALNIIWERTDETHGAPLAAAGKRLLSMTMVLGVGLLLLLSLVFDAGITTLGGYAGHHLAGGTWLWKALQLLLSVGVFTVLFAILFRLLPEVDVKWRESSRGAAVTAFLFVLGKFALGLYLSRAAVGSSFGAAGSIIVVLVWVYWSALIFLFGVEFTHVYVTAAEGPRARERLVHLSARE